ncbi:MAG: 30S ribosomal protein S6 [Planctomycetes bacterium]|nr:30S ribosomal protein S6 [Planctomycetota bacterium]
MRIYEAMFLFDPAYANDFSKVEQEVGRLLERVGAEPIMTRKWEERRLAYEIQGRKRGCYVLCFFRGSPEKIVDLERDARLSEPILRLLVLKADHLSEEDMEKAYRSRAEPAEGPPRETRRGDAPAPAGTSDRKPAQSDDKPVGDKEAAPADKATPAEKAAPAAEAAPAEKAADPVEPAEATQSDGASTSAPAEAVPAADPPVTASE